MFRRSPERFHRNRRQIRTVPDPPAARSAEVTSSVFVTGASGPGFLGAGVLSDVTVAGAEFGILAGRPMVRPTRVETRPDIDGRINGEVWRSVASITEFIQESPLDGAPATERTEVRVAYDEQNLYMAFHILHSGSVPKILNKISDLFDHLYKKVVIYHILY